MVKRGVVVSVDVVGEWTSWFQSGAGQVCSCDMASASEASSLVSIHVLSNRK